MKYRNLVGCSCVLLRSVAVARSQETTNSETFSKQLKELRESFERQQREQRENFEKQQRELREEFDKKFQQQQAQIEALSQTTNVSPAIAQTNAVIADQLQELNQKVDNAVEAQKKVRPGEFNPAI